MEQIEMDGTSVRYRVDGKEDGPPVLLINSLGTDHSMWQPQMTRFVSGHRVVRYEARGQGGSPSPPPPYSLADLGGDAVGLLDHLEVEQAHVVGVSLGGLVALWLSIHRPARLLSLTAANTAARIGTPDGWDQRIEAVRRGGMAAVRDHVMKQFFSDRFRAEDPLTVAATARVLEQHEPDGYVGYCAALREADLRAEVADIEVPVLVIGGTEDVSTPAEEARWLADRIPEAELTLLDAGHLSNLERPEDFDDAVLGHISSTDPRRPSVEAGDRAP